jgi:hypothetical protein
MKKSNLLIAMTISALCLSSVAVATPFYTQNFEVDSSATWTLNGGPSDEAADYYYDYSSAGIPQAPNSTGISRRGMKLQANLSDGIFGGMSVSPTGLSLPTTYTLKFDWWSNSIGPFPGGGSGSTNLSLFGVGTAGNSAQWQGAATWDSVFFAASSDGNTANDYRAYSNNSGAPLGGIWPETSGVYAAGNVAGVTNNSNAHYSTFGGLTAPSDQLTLYPGQTGTTLVGSGMWAWHEVEIVKSTTNVVWSIDGKTIATIPLAGAPGQGGPIVLGGNNILFGHSDINAGSSTSANDAALLFTLIDNIEVIPEPTSLSLLGLSVVGLLLGRARR